MAAVAPLSAATATAPPPPANAAPSAPQSAPPSAPPPVSAAPAAPLPQGPPEAPGPTALQIQSVLTSVELALDNLPQEQPNAPLTIALEGQVSTLRSALTQVSLGEVDSSAGYFSGLLLNASA